MASADSSVTGKKTAPYGTWRSPITSDLVADAGKRLEGLSVDSHNHLVWLESRPSDSGRCVIVREGDKAGDDPVDVTPFGFSVRSTAQEYGGGAFSLWGETLVFSNSEDQRLYKQLLGSLDSTTVPLTPDYGGPKVRYADGVFDARFNRFITVREDHRRTGAQATTELACVFLSGENIKEPEVLVSGNDFYAFPRLDPKGERLAWVEWSHPNMHWDSAELWVGYISDTGDISKRVCIAGSDPSRVESPTEPKWSSKGELFFITDRNTGFWNIHKWNEEKSEVHVIYSLDAEFGRPLWVFGISSYDFIQRNEKNHVLACSYRQNGRSYLCLIDENKDSLSVVDVPFTYINNIISTGHFLYIEGASATYPMSLAKVAFQVEKAEVTEFQIVWSSSSDVVKYRSYFSLPHLIQFPTKVAGQNAYAYFYPPSNPDYEASRGEHPPLLLESHGTYGDIPEILVDVYILSSLNCQLLSECHI